MRKLNAWAIVGLLLASGSAHAGLIGPHSILDLGQKADLILVGSAGGTYQSGLPASFSLQVSRVIKGDTNLAGSTLSVAWSNSAQGAVAAGTSLTISGDGIWFLQQSTSGWQLLPVVDGAVAFNATFYPAPTGPVISAYAYGATAALTDKLGAELSSAIENAGGTYNFQLYALQFGLLDQLQSSAVSLLYQRLSSSTSPQQRILGLSGAIRAGGSAALSAAVSESGTSAQYAQENGILLLSLRDYFRAADVNSVSALGQAAVDTTNSNTAFREAAAHALSAVHTNSALPYLADLLDDTDFTLQVEGIGGLGAFANGLPAQSATGVPGLTHLQLPASAPYKTADTVANFAMGTQAIAQKPSTYLSFWKTWWAQNRASLGY
jgi:hypothetical protein